jgi:hypothetical protein
MAVVKSTGGTLATCGVHQGQEDSQSADLVLAGPSDRHLAGYFESLRLFADIRDPLSSDAPYMDGRMGLSTMLKGVDVYGRYAYLNARQQTVMALRLSRGNADHSRPESPRKLTAKRIGLK